MHSILKKYPLRCCLLAVLSTVTTLTGCASAPNRWVLIEPQTPARLATAVSTSANGGAWFFQCDEQSLTAGLKLGAMAAVPEQEQQISIKFDAEPAELSNWGVGKGSYVIRGDAAIALARRAALAYDAEVGVGGTVTHFSLTGSHVAMIAMTRSCPYLDVQ